MISSVVSRTGSANGSLTSLMDKFHFGLAHYFNTSFNQQVCWNFTQKVHCSIFTSTSVHLTILSGFPSPMTTILWKSWAVSHWLTNTQLSSQHGILIFSPSSQAFSEPHEDFCRLGSAAWHAPRSQAPCFFGFQNPSSPKLSVAADFQRMPYQHCSTKIRRNAFSSIWGWLRTLLVLPFAFIISQKWGMKLTLLVLLCFLQSHQGLVWRNTSLPTFPLFLAHIIKYLSQLSNLLSVFLYRILCSKRTGNFTYPLPHPQYPEEHQDKTGIHKLIKTNLALWC